MEPDQSPGAEPSQGPGVESLRSGVVFAGNLMLLERVPRWVAQRRFRARRIDDGSMVGVLILKPGTLGELDIERTLESCRGLRHKAWVLPEIFDEFQGIEYAVCEWTNGPTVADFIRKDPRKPPGREILMRLLNALSEADDAGVELGRVHSDSVMLVSEAEADSDAPPSVPRIFPVGLDGIVSEMENITGLAGVARALLPRGSGAGELLDRARHEPEAFVTLEVFMEQLRTALTSARAPVSREGNGVTPSGTASGSVRRRSSRSEDVAPASMPTDSNGNGAAPAPTPGPSKRVEGIAAGLVLASAVGIGGFTWWLAGQLANPVAPTPVAAVQPEVATQEPAEESAEDAIERARVFERHGNPAGALLVWVELLSDEAHSAAAWEASTRLVAGAREDLPNLRMGIRPQMVRPLETAADAGFSPASELLEEVRQEP